MAGLVASPMITTEILVAGQWLIKQKIGSGSFGEIYEAYDIHTNQRVAVKIESCDSKYPQLVEEHKVYISIHGHSKSAAPQSYHYSNKHSYGGRHHHSTDGGMEPPSMPGFPKIYWFGSIEQGKFHALVMELLGDSLETLYNRCNRKFTLKTVLQLSFQLIDRIEQQHKCGWLHRDIKPDNFLMGGTGETASTLFVIDMGLCKQFKDPVTGEHIQYKDNKKLIGTPRYASLNTHLGIEQCRRDDLESIGYMLLYLLIGKLPWQGLKAKNKQEKYERISAKKSSVSVEALCKGCPGEFVRYLHYARQLKFTDKPDYRQLKKMFRDLYHKKGFKDDQQYDWMTPSTAQQPTLSQQSIAVTKPLQLAMQRPTSQQQHAALLQQQQSQQATVANLYAPNVSPTGNEDKENGARQQSTTAQAPQRQVVTYHTVTAYAPQYASTAMLPPQHPANAAAYPQQQQAYNAAAAVYARHSASSPFLQTAPLHSPAVSSGHDVVGHSSNSPSPVQANYQAAHLHPAHAMLPVGTIPADLAQYNAQLYAAHQQQLAVPTHSRQSTHASTTPQFGKPATAAAQQRQTSTQPQPPSPSGDQLTHLNAQLAQSERSKEHYKNMCNKYDVMLTRAEQEMRKMLDHIAMHCTQPFNLDYPLAGGYQPPANAQPQHTAAHQHKMQLRSSTQRQTTTTQPAAAAPAANVPQPRPQPAAVKAEAAQPQRAAANDKPQSVKRKLDISAAESDFARDQSNASKRPANFSATQPATYFLDTNIAQQASSLLHSFQHAEPYSSNSDGSRPSFGAAAAYEQAGLPNASNLRRGAGANLIQTF